MGKEVKRLKEGDVVFCCLPFKDGGSFDLLSGIANWQATDRFGTGSVSEYALVIETAVVLKPKFLNFVQAASIPLVALTAAQMFERVVGGVEGKTVFVPAGRK